MTMKKKERAHPMLYTPHISTLSRIFYSPHFPHLPTFLPLLPLFSLLTDMALERPLTPQEEFDEQRTWLLEEKLHQQHQMARGGADRARVQTIESRIKLVQERLQYFATRRGESIDFYSREKARRQQEWHGRSDTQGIDVTKAFTSNTAYGPMPPTSQWKKVPETRDQYRRAGTGQPTNRTLSDIKLEPYQFPGTIHPAYQNDQEAKRRAERFYYRMRGAMDVTAGASPVEAILRDPEINAMLRRGEISTQHLAAAVGIMQDLRGQQMETALRQLAGETGSSSFSSPYLQQQMPSREKREAAIKGAQAQIDAWREKTAKNAAITTGQLQQILPHLSDEQLAFVESLDKNPQAELKAGPGSGKTDTLLAGWLHLVFNKRVDPSQINMVSVTKSGRDALTDRIKRAATLVPQWNFDTAKDQQFRTMHSLFLQGLYERDDQNQSVLERMGMGHYSLLGAGASNVAGMTLEAAAESADNDRRKYLDRLLQENNIKRRQSLDKILNHISAIKQNQGQQTKLPDNSRTRQYEEHYKRGRDLYRSGNTTDLDSLFFLYESNLKGKEGMPGIQGQKQRRFDLDDVPYMYQLAAAKGIASQLKDIIVDEYQTLQPDMIRALRRGSGPGTHLPFAGDPGQHVMGHGRPDVMVPQAFPQIAQHALTGNYRGTAWSVATFNAINQHPSVQQTGFSPPQVSMSGNIGQAPTYTTASSFSTLHTQAFDEVLKRIGIDLQRMKQNIGRGAHPLAGATIAPVQAPLIFMMHRERDDFLQLVEEQLANEIGPAKARRAMKQVFSRENPASGDELSSPLSHRQIPAILVQQAQSRGFAHPHNFVTRGGQWDDGDYWRMVSIMESRTTEQSHYYATNKNFKYSPGFDNSFDFDPATGTNLPHGFARIQSASHENLVHAQGVPYESLSPAQQYHVNMPLPESSGGNSNAALMQVIEGAMDLHKTVPVGSRIGMIGEDAGLLPGQLEGEYGDDARKTLSGFSTSSYTHAALSGKYDMAPDMGKFQAGLQYASNLLEAGPTADQGYPLESVSGFFSEAKGTLGKPPKRLMQLDEAELPNEVVIQEHDMPKKDWGKSRFEPRHYHQDELRVRGGIQEMLGSKAAQQHPLVKQMFDEEIVKPPMVRRVRRLAKRYGMKPLAQDIDRASVPIDQVRKALEGTGKQGDEPGLYQQFYRATKGIVGSPNRAQIVAQARAHKFKGLTFKGLDSEKSQKVLGLARDIAVKEDLIKQMEEADPSTIGMQAVAELIHHAMSKRFDYEEGHAPARVLAQKAVEEVSRLIASASLDNFTVERLKEIGHDLMTNPEYDLSDEQRQDFASVVSDLENFAQPTFDHDLSGRLTEEELAGWKQRDPRKGALLETILRDKNTGELKDFNQAYASIKDFQHMEGKMVRGINSPEKAAALGISIPESRRAPFQTEMRAYSQRLEESGIVDPQAYIAREGKSGMEFFHTGEMTGLEMYQRRLEEIAYGQPRAGRIQPSEDQRQLAYQQLGLVRQLRSELHSSVNQEAWGHTLNILSRVVYGEGAYDPGDRSPEGQYTAGFRDMFKYQKMEGLEGSRTLEQVQSFVEAMQEGTSHIRQTGTIKREHVNRIMAALGHTDLEGQQYTGLHALASQFGSPESEFPLSDLTRNTDLVRQFPSDLNNQYSQLTRLPLGMGREYMFAGGTPGFAPIITGNEAHPGGQVGMTTGMRGTLQPWSPSGKDFGMSKTKGAYIGERLFTPQEANAAYGMGRNDPLAPLFRFQERESGKTYPVRADQLIDPSYLPMLGTTSTSAVTPSLQGSPHTVEASAGISSRAALTDQYRQMTPEARQALRAQLFGRGRNTTAVRVSQSQNSRTLSGSSPLLLPSPRISARRSSALSRLGGSLGSGNGTIALGPHITPPHLQLPAPRARGLSRYQQGLARSQGSRVLPAGAGAIALPSRVKRPLAYPARMVGAVSPLERHLFSSSSSPSSPRSLSRGTPPPVRPFRVVSGLTPDERNRFAKVLPAWAKALGKQPTRRVSSVFASALPPLPGPQVVNTGVPLLAGHTGAPPLDANVSVEDQMRDIAGWIRTGSDQFGMHKLSDEQREAVESSARFRMISGGPGGGKTNTIAGATGDWIATGGMLPANIVSVSALHSGEEELNSRLDTPRALVRRGSDPRYELPKSSTIHSLAHDILLGKDEESGKYPQLEQMGITNYSGRILYEPDAAKRETMSQAQYEQVSQIHFLQQQIPGLPHKDAKEGVEFINNMKANRFGEGADYESALKQGRDDLSAGATIRVGKGRGQRSIPTYTSMLAQMHDTMKGKGDIDYNDLLYMTARHLEQNGMEGLPMHLRSTTGVVLDEGQDITRTGADMVGQFMQAISGNTPSMLIGMDPAQSLLPQTFGAVDVNKVEGLYETMAQGMGEPLEKHTLKENRRSDLSDILFNNAIRNRPILAGTARSPEQSMPEGGSPLGRYQSFNLAQTHPQMFRNMWRSMLKTSGASYNDIGANVQAGKHPFAGIDFSAQGKVMPKDIPAILNEHKDQSIFAHEATSDIAQQLGVGHEDAKKLYGQMTSSKMYKRPLISRLLRRSEKPSEEELAKMAQFPVVRHSGARSFDALHPHVDVTRSYGGDDPTQSLISHFKKMFVALSRVKSGGQNKIFATNRPLQAYHKSDYLKYPELFKGGMTDMKGNLIPGDGEEYAFKQYGNMQVPPFFDQLLGDRDKALLKSGAVSPTDSFFPPEVQPAIQQIAQDLGIGGQQQQPAPPSASSQVGVGSASSSPSSSPSQDPYVAAGLRHLYGTDETAQLFRKGASPHNIEKVKASLHAYPGELRQQLQNRPVDEHGKHLNFLAQSHFDSLTGHGPLAGQVEAGAKLSMLDEIRKDIPHFLAHAPSPQQVPVRPSDPPGMVRGVPHSVESSSPSPSSAPLSAPLSAEQVGLQYMQSPEAAHHLKRLSRKERKDLENVPKMYAGYLRNQFADTPGVSASDYIQGVPPPTLGIAQNAHGLVFEGIQRAIIEHFKQNPSQLSSSSSSSSNTVSASTLNINAPNSTVNFSAPGGKTTGGSGQTPPSSPPPGGPPPSVTPGGPGPNTTTYLGSIKNGQLNFGAPIRNSAGGAGTPGTTSGGNTFTGLNPDAPWFAASNPTNQLARTLARVGTEIAFTGGVLKQHAVSAAMEGSKYRQYTIPIVPGAGTTDAYGNVYQASDKTQQSQVANIISQLPGLPGGSQNTANIIGGQKSFTDRGTQGFFDFNSGNPGTIGYLEKKTLPMYSKTEIVQGIHDYMASTGASFGKGSVGATTDIMGIAALAGMDPSQLMQQMTQISGYTAGSPNANNANISQLSGFMQNTFGGNYANYSQQNVVPYLTAMSGLTPTLYGAGLNAGPGPTYGTGYSGQSQLHAASLLKLALNAGYTSANLPDVGNALGNLAQIGMTPNTQQQYQLAQLYGEGQLTASPQYFEFQQQQLGQKQQIAQMQLGLNINQGTPGAQKLSVSQLQINATNASIAMDKANLTMSQEQFAQNTASFNFNQWMQTQELGPIGATPQQTGRADYFAYMNRQMGAGYNPLNAESASTFQFKGQPMGLQNVEFYAGIEHQRNMLSLSKSPLLADAAYQEQMKYLNQQETFYNQQLQLQNKDRAFQQTWGQKSLNAQAGVLAAQQKQFAVQLQQASYEKQMAAIQGKFMPLQLDLLKKISDQSLQQIQGMGPIRGQNVQPGDLIQHLADMQKSQGYNATQQTIQGMGISAQDQGILMQLVQSLASGKSSLSDIEKQLSGSGDKQLLAELQLFANQGAWNGQKQQAGTQDKSLAQGGTGPDWKNLTNAVNNSVAANNKLAQYLAPSSTLQLYLGEIGTNLGPVATGISSLVQLIGVFGGGGAGGAGIGGRGTGGVGSMSGIGASGGSMLPLPSMQIHGPYGGARGGSGVGGEFDFGPSLPDNKYTKGWLGLFEAMVAYKQKRTNSSTVSHYGISSPNVNADFHEKLWYGIHQGVDFAAAQGTPLLSFNDGKVLSTGFYPWGGEVDVQIPGGLTERYLHLSQIGVTSGQKIKAGDRLGLTGGGTKQSGLGQWSKGAHSHVQIDQGNINQGINPWVIWAAFGDTNLRDFYVGAQAQSQSSPYDQYNPHGYQRSGGKGGAHSLFHLAEGGIAMKPLTARLMDAGEPEAVIPLSKLKSVMASVTSGSPARDRDTTTTPASKQVTIHTLVGTMQVTIHTQAATMSDQEKDNLFTDLLDVLDKASQELLGTLQ